MNERHDLNTQQLELTFNGTAGFTPAIRRARRVVRAQWWFTQMHKAVANAFRPPTPARPEQARLAFGSLAATGWFVSTRYGAPQPTGRS